MKTIVFVFLILVLFAVPPILLAQRTTGGIAGTVSDETGAVLPGVTVTVTGANIAAMQTYVTGAQGSYRFPTLPPGSYDVTFVLDGFATLSRQQIVVSVGGIVALNAALPISQVSETVTVIGETPVVDTRSTHLDTTYDREWVENGSRMLRPNASSFSTTSMRHPASLRLHTIVARPASWAPGQTRTRIKWMGSTSPRPPLATPGPGRTSTLSKRSRFSHWAPRPSTPTRVAASSTSSPARGTTTSPATSTSISRAKASRAGTPPTRRTMACPGTGTNLPTLPASSEVLSSKTSSGSSSGTSTKRTASHNLAPIRTSQAQISTSATSRSSTTR